jgi:hypothetical protein
MHRIHRVTVGRTSIDNLVVIYRGSDIHQFNHATPASVRRLSALVNELLFAGRAEIRACEVFTGWSAFIPENAARA